jgi:hypothetical protein
MKSIKLMGFFVLATVAMSFTRLDAVKANQLTTWNKELFSSVKWEKESIDLGEIPSGKPVTIEFVFTNTSKDPVIVTDVRPSCGCTVADYPKEAVLAGRSATIKATYNAAARGAFNKNLTVMIQNEEPKVLNFKGTVI